MILLHARELTRIEAEEDLRMFECFAAGSGMMKASDRRQYLSRLRRQAQETTRERPTISQEQGEVMLAAMGVKVCRKASAKQS